MTRQPKRRVRFKDFKTRGPGDIRPFSVLFQHISLKALIGKNQNFPFHLYAFSVSPMFSEVKTHLALCILYKFSNLRVYTGQGQVEHSTPTQSHLYIYMSH